MILINNDDVRAYIIIIIVELARARYSTQVGRAVKKRKNFFFFLFSYTC